VEILIRLLILLFLSFFGISSQSGSPPPPVDDETPVAEPTFESLTLIDSVEATVLETAPAQLQVRVRGSQPDGCDFPVQVEQTRAGNAVTLKIYRDVPLTVMCPAMLVMYDQTITLDGGFEAGTYTIDVNGFVVEVVI
jgi:hypothetical protein